MEDKALNDRMTTPLKCQRCGKPTIETAWPWCDPCDEIQAQSEEMVYRNAKGSRDDRQAVDDYLRRTLKD